MTVDWRRGRGGGRLSLYETESDMATSVYGVPACVRKGSTHTGADDACNDAIARGVFSLSEADPLSWSSTCQPWRDEPSR